MTLETILTIYSIVTATVLLISALAMLSFGEELPEIDNFYDWLFYGIFWIFILIKYMIKFLFKLFQR